MTVDDDDDYYSDIHPPNVVLVSSNPASPGQDDHHHHPHSMRSMTAGLCSPLSTAPNSPYRGVSDDDDDDDEEDEIRPEEIEELLQVPPSPTVRMLASRIDRKTMTGGRTTAAAAVHVARSSEVPFDCESHHNNKRAANHTNNNNNNKQQQPTTTTAIDPLLGHPRRTSRNSHNTKKPLIAVVSPSSTIGGGREEFEEEIDAYVEEDEEEDQGKEEKKVDDAVISPPRSPHYAGYLANYKNNSNGKTVQQQQQQQYEDDSVPDDERVVQASPSRDFIQASRSGDPRDAAAENDNDKNNATTTPMKRVLQTAEREVQEMERRVQQMIEQRRQTSQRSQQRFVKDDDDHDHDDPPLDSHTMNSSNTSSEEVEELEGEPPSLSPRGPRATRSRSAINANTNTKNNTSREINSSLESGCSSYYYDGSVMGSNGSSTNTSGLMLGGGVDDANNTTIHTTSSELTAALQQQSNTKTYARLENSESALDDQDISRESIKSSSFEDFTSRFDHEAQNGSFAKAISDTSRAFHQVTEDVANFLVLPTARQQQQQQPPTTSTSTTRGGQQGQLSPVSPSSDCTPQLGNLSPKPVNRRHSTSTGKTGDAPINAELMYKYRQRPSYKLEKARSLVQSRLSPTHDIHHEEGDGGSAGGSGSKQRARQVVNKREREQHQTSSKTLASASLPCESSNRNSASHNETNTSNSSMNIPVPPSLFRIAAMMEGLGGSSDEANPAARGGTTAEDEADTDWPTSVSQLMEEYQTAVTESLRNLSMDEIAGLAQNGGIQQQQEEGAPKFGKSTLSSPGVSLSPVRDINNRSYDEYDDAIAEMTMGACLQMPNLNHPPLLTSRSTSTAQNGKDYYQAAAGVLQYDTGMELQYHDEKDDGNIGGQPLFEDDVEHEERAVFATQLSERLLNLGPNSSTDTSGSIAYRESPEKFRGDKNLSFDSKDSSLVMSPPKRRNPAYANKDAMTDIAESTNGGGGGLFVSSMQQNRCLPSSEQPSVCSNGYSPARERKGVNNQDRPTSSANLNSRTGGISALTQPTMVQSIDNETGIGKGDVMLSLLCDNSFQASNEKPDSWAWRVREAIWRCRDMRRDIFAGQDGAAGAGGHGNLREQFKRAPSLPVDVDDVRVVGGINNVASIQEKALAHMRENEFEESLELYEDIIFNYYNFFEQVLANRDQFSSDDVTEELSNFKPYIGASLHNLGVIHLLKGDYEDAFSFFKRAVDNRRACLGEDHSDCITSLVRLATCHFAVDNFADAHTNLELALALAGSNARTTNDYCQLGEILNNLGCLSYMSGQPTKAMKLFRESLDVQLAVLNSTLYGGSKYSAHSATLSISITRGNIGFLALVLKDVSSGILALESALREQRLLLKGAHVTLVSTMDHLAVANLLEGRTQKAIKMLRRIYDLQTTAHGPNDPRCAATKQKIMTIRGQQIVASKNASFDQQQQHQHRPSQAKKEAETRTAPRPEPERQRSQRSSGGVGGGEPTIATTTMTKHLRRPSEGSTARCIGGNGNGNSNNQNGGKVNSMFKAIRSLGRKKNPV